MVLSVDAVTSFDEDGFFVVPNLLTEAEVAELRGETEDLHERLARQVPDGAQVSWTRRDGRAVIEQVLHAELVSPALARIVEGPRLLELVRELLGPDAALYHTKFVMKAAEVGGQVPWHQDFPYWAACQSAPQQVSVLAYIDDADEENGCLEVIPGSQARGLVPHAVLGGDATVFAHRLAGDGHAGRPPVKLPGTAGTGIVFGPLLVHSSAPNRTRRQRRSLTITYTPASIPGERRKVFSLPDPVPNAEEFFALTATPFLSGPGPMGGQCARAYLRRELWRLAMSEVRAPDRVWVEVVESQSDGASFDFLASHKPAATPLVRFEKWPAARSNRADAVVVTGALPRTLGSEALGSRLQTGLGLTIIDTDRYVPARVALAALAPALVPGSVLVFDKFCGFEGWQEQAAKAWYELIQARGIRARVLGRTHRQVAFAVDALGVEPEVRSAELDYRPVSYGVVFGLRSFYAQTNTPREEPVHAERAPRRLARQLAELLPFHEVPRVIGEGPYAKESATHSRRRELWHYALSLVDDPRASFCEFGVAEGESLDYLALHKSESATLFGFDSFAGIPERWANFPAGHWSTQVYESNRPDVVICKGSFDDTLADPKLLERLGPRLGLLHVDCDLYSSTRTVFERLASRIDAGTVVIFDELYGYPGWELHEARAFAEFVAAERVEFELLARSDCQVALRILGKGKRARSSVRRLDHVGRVPGVTILPPGPVSPLRRAARTILDRSGVGQPARRLYLAALRAREDARHLVRGRSAGTLLPEEAASIAKYAAEAREVAVEIGAAEAGPAALISKSLPAEAELFTLDCGVDSLPWSRVKARELLQRGVVMRAGAPGKVRFLRGSVAGAASDFARPIDLLWLSGEHGYEDAKRAFELWSGKLRAGGYLLFGQANRADLTSDESYERGWCGPTLVCDEIMRERAGEYEPLEATGSIRAFRKRAQSRA